MNTYLQEYEKYKDCNTPELNEIFIHPTQRRGDQIAIEYRVIKYSATTGIVETVHSKRQAERTLHWIRKMYNKEK